MIAKNHKIFGYLVTYLLTVFIYFLVSPTAANAASGVGLNNYFPNPNNSSPVPTYLTVGVGDFDSRIAGAIIITDSTGAFTLTVDDAHWCNDSLDVPSSFGQSYAVTSFQVWQLGGSSGSYYQTGSKAYVDTGGYIERCDAAGAGADITFNFNIDDNDYNYNIGKYVVAVAGVMGTTNPAIGSIAAWENSFRFIVSGPGGPVMTLMPPTLYGGNFYNFSNSNKKSTHTILSASVYLATPCSLAPQPITINFYDADDYVSYYSNRGQWQSNSTNAAYNYPLNFYVRDGASGATPTNTLIANKIFGGNREYSQNFSFNLAGAKTYQFQVTGLTKPNTISFQFNTNVDTLFGATICPPPNRLAECTLTASTTTPLPGAEVQITATVTNRSGYDWPYNGSTAKPNNENFTIAPVDYDKSYAKLSLPRVDGGDSPGGTSGPPDWNNGSFVVNKAGTNTSPYPLTYSQYGNLVGLSGIIRFVMMRSIALNGSATFSFYVKAPSTAGNSLKVGARIMDRKPLGGSFWFNEYNPGGCTVTITAANPVSATCSFTSPTREPESYTPTVTVNNTSTTDNTFRVSFDIPGKGVYSSASTGVSISGGSSSILSAGSVTFSNGDEKSWPVTVTVYNVATGLAVGSGCSGNISVVRKPFFRVNNGDLIVGGKYSNGPPNYCTGVLDPTDVNLSSWTDRANNRGANAEHVIKVLSGVFEVYSARSITTPPSGLANKWLTIANTNTTDIWGTGAGNASCLKDMYSDTLKTDSAVSIPSPHSLDTLITGDQAKRSGDLTLNSTGVFSGKRAIYVTGNVYISSNIILSTTYTDRASIPFFALIVKGNIYIDPSVTQLDGMYVAQPDGASGGAIFTCATASGAIAQSSLYSLCNNSLTFNGIVQAKDIKLLRTNGTLAANTPAEIFNNLPELYIAPTPFKKSSSTGYQYDSAVTLPPSL